MPKDEGKDGLISASAQRKMLNYVASLLGNKEFLDAVKNIRRKFSLPEQGFENELEDELSFIRKLSPYIEKNGEETLFDKEVHDLSLRFHLTLPWIEVVKKYVLYNRLFVGEIEPFIQVVDFFQLLQEQHNQEPLEDEGGEEISPDFAENIATAFPVGIFVSPYATGRDIIEYVKKWYKKEIEPVQKGYRDNKAKIGLVRKRSDRVRDRDNFIFENRHLPMKKIAELARKKFGGAMGYDYVSKIIQRKQKETDTK